MSDDKNVLVEKILRGVLFSKINLVRPIVDFYLKKEFSKSDLVFSHFFAQLAHESDNFKTLTEYASGQSYEGRKDLGNIEKGDGVRFKGRGYIQLTGRANYKKASDMFDIDLINKPDLLSSDPVLALGVAAWFWNERKLSDLAMKNDVVGITKKINGGLNGIEDRKNKVNIFKRIFGLI